MSAMPARRGRNGIVPIALWLALMVACLVVIARSHFTADLSAFMPRNPTPAQQLLLAQIRDGLASRLILVGIEGADAAAHATLSRQVAQRLRGDAAFVTVNNGETVSLERDRAYLFNNRYLLSPAVTPERFSTDGLRDAISESIDLLASPAGLLVRSLLPRDPTGEMVQLLEQLNSGNRPRVIDGAWASRDGKRALLLLQTRADGADTDAQQRAMAVIQQAFEAARGSQASARLVMSGPGVFSVTARESIQHQVSRLSVVGVAIVATLLLLVYRSFTALALGFLPVLCGALAGIAAVSLGFGTVHGITLGFGTALIGEAVDYSIYLFVQSEQHTGDSRNWIEQFWPTIRLGVLTSIFGFASLLLSGFPGLAQLGLYSIAGLVAAALLTRFVLPHLLPANFRIHDVSPIGRVLARLVRRAGALRWAALIVLAAACVIVVMHRGQVWNDKLSSLSPVSQAEVDLDTALRADMGAPDVRYVVVVSGADREAVLESSEKVAARLQTQVEQGTLAAFDSPSRFLPSIATQRARQASLPEAAVLETRLAQAVRDLPLRATVLAPFVADVAAARSQPLLQVSDLENTSMAMAVSALLVQQDRKWHALLPLTAPAGRDIDAARVRAALETHGVPEALMVDMTAESNNLYAGYLQEAIALSLGGLAAILGMLLIACRSPLRVARIVAPLLAAVVTVTAGLTLWGQQLTILHLVGLLLVVAIGSNYALFFDRPEQTSENILPRTLASMLLANITTVAGFGTLAFSSISILKAMGTTVAPGVILALIYAAIFARKDHA